jgi:PAS domain S-box-containing protein
VKANTPYSGRHGELFDQLPCGIVVLDRELRIADHNHHFADIFGEGLGHHCYEKYKERAEPCANCPALQTFADGKQRVLEECGTDCFGQSIEYLVQMTPLLDGEGNVEHVAVITTDLTATKRLQQEYRILFEKVPCYVAVINRDHRVVKANEMFRRTFGEPRGELCYRLFKQRRDVCPDCPALETFRDGKAHTAQHSGVTRDGAPTQYIVSTAPLLLGNDGEVAHVVEMGLDVTEARELERELARANTLREALVENSLDAIVVLDAEQHVVLMNRAAEALWNAPRERTLGRKARQRMMPPALEQLLAGAKQSVILLDTSIRTLQDEKVPVRLAGVALEENGREIGVAVMAQDLRPLKQLEKDKLEAERLAAVGQTVAGLAHGIKNILTGLTGGMYVTTIGLKHGDQSRVERGWGMMERNIERIAALAKNLLAFSRGDEPKPALTDPAQIVRDVVELFREHANQHGIQLDTEIADEIALASLDAEGIHSCLTNLVSNAVDACLVSQNDDCRITVRLTEDDDGLAFAVKDTGCGMDYEVKQKAFTTFFTTKGSGGSGLGLLTTRKIVQQHGGEVTFDTTPGEGTVFRLRFRRERLPRLVDPAGEPES